MGNLSSLDNDSTSSVVSNKNVSTEFHWRRTTVLTMMTAISIKLKDVHYQLLYILRIDSFIVHCHSHHVVVVLLLLLSLSSSCFSLLTGCQSFQIQDVEVDTTFTKHFFWGERVLDTPKTNRLNNKLSWLVWLVKRTMPRVVVIKDDLVVVVSHRRLHR